MGFVLVEVIIAQNVQESMDHEVGEVVLEGDALLLRLALQRFRGRGDIAEQAGNRPKWLDLGKAQDVGGLVDPRASRG